MTTLWVGTQDKHWLRADSIVAIGTKSNSTTDRGIGVPVQLSSKKDFAIVARIAGMIVGDWSDDGSGEIYPHVYRLASGYSSKQQAQRVVEQLVRMLSLSAGECAAIWVSGDEVEIESFLPDGDASVE